MNVNKKFDKNKIKGLI